MNTMNSQERSWNSRNFLEGTVDKVQYICYIADC